MGVIIVGELSLPRNIQGESQGTLGRREVNPPLKIHVFISFPGALCPSSPSLLRATWVLHAQEIQPIGLSGPLRFGDGPLWLRTTVSGPVGSLASLAPKILHPCKCDSASFWVPTIPVHSLTSS